jgi:DNA-binding response OmpR family regulator
MNKRKILIIEDEEAITDILSYSLSKESYITFVAHEGNEGIEKVKIHKPDMILLDLMLPDISGFEVCRKLSKEYNIPIIIITAISDTMDRILGIELGADDYITKPFEIREVSARIKAIFRRIELTEDIVENNPLSVIKLPKNIEINTDERNVFKNNVAVELTNKEYDLLLFLAENKGKVFTRSILLDKVWGFDFVVDTRTVDIHVQRIRKKLDENKNTSLIETVFGVGYKISK